MLRAFRPLLAAEREAVELCDFRRQVHWGQRVMVTCEHASNGLPEPYSWSKGDEKLKDTHWAYDPGAADTAKLLAQKLQTISILSKFTRLLLDSNRTLYSETLFRKMCDGRALDLNSGLSAEERHNRINRFHVPYHLLVGEIAEFLDPDLIISIHTFTPNYEGQIRSVELGVLYEDYDAALALYTQAQFQSAGFDTRLNEPWSGKVGLMPVAMGVKFAKGDRLRDTIELEIRNDLATDAVIREKIVQILVDVAERQVQSHQTPNP